MNDALNDALALVAKAPVDECLHGMTDRVMTRLASDGIEARRTTGLGAATTLSALALGIFVSTIAVRHESAAPVALLDVSSLAPSTLLENVR